MNPLPRQHAGQHAFTLIELLVVISIIALLVAILLPSLRSSRIAANKTASLSNLRQIAIASTSYASDNNSNLLYSNRAKFQAGVWDNQYALHKAFWAGQLKEEGYVASSKVFWAPGRNTGSINPQNPVVTGGFSDYRYTSYGTNTAALGTGEHAWLNYRDGLTGGSILGKPLQLGEANAPQPSKMIIYAEGGRADIEQQGFYVVSPRFNSQSGAGSYLMYNYMGAMPRVYVDGHGNAFARNSGRLTLSTPNPSYILSTPDDNAFDTSFDGTPKLGFTPPEFFKGWWAIANNTTRQKGTPWYDQWRTQGYD